MQIMRTLWIDETGFIVSAEMILVASIVVLGMIVGMTVVRDTMITELSDTATAIGQMNQSYSFGGARGSGSSIAGSFFTDAQDSGDSTASSSAGTGTGCTSFVSTPATPELAM